MSTESDSGVDSVISSPASIIGSPGSIIGSPGSVVGSPESANNESESVAESPVAAYSVHKLPPCKVCGEQASGFHYGVNTCEACKGFFRRCLQRKGAYKCIEDGNCEIKPGKRSLCAHCRHKKCIAVGMSKTAIKTGRYTHAKRTQDIKEIKKIERKDKQEDTVVKDKIHDDIIAALEKSQKDNPFHPADYFDKLEERQNKFLLEYEYNRDVFGLVSPITRSEYMEFFHTTGMDIDGRRQMLSLCIPSLEKAIRRYIDFAKCIPGFKDLLMEDQIVLIKAARFEVLLLCYYKGYNMTHDIVTGTSGRTHHINELARVHDEEFLHCCFRLARKLQTFGISDIEVLLLQAIVIFFTDRCELKQPEQVERTQHRIVELLQKKTAELHPLKPNLFAILIGFLADMRIATEKYLNHCEHIKVIVNEMELQVPPLISEMCT